MMVEPELKVQQANCFYNYAIGLDVNKIDLVETAKELLRSGIATSVFFSDLKVLYTDTEGCTQLEWLRPQGRRWGSNWKVSFSDSLPNNVVMDLAVFLELQFHEFRIDGNDTGELPSCLRASLPPLVLEDDNMTLPVYPWLKLYSDGLMCISFQLDATWNDISEEDFINIYVNLFQCYFKSIWVKAELQRIDGELLLPDAFKGFVSIGGRGVANRRANNLVKKMGLSARMQFEKLLSVEGRVFELHKESWLLHQIAGSESEEEWEGTIDLCRSIYTNVMVSKIVPVSPMEKKRKVGVKLWQGRPSISLMRFSKQPQSKEQSTEEIALLISRLLMRSSRITIPPPLPPDLRPFDDYFLHGGRASLLWTWVRDVEASDNAWDDPKTKSRVLENQARAEQFEYHNIRIARACALAEAPQSDQQLVYAYETLANAESVLHKSSQAGEITEALDFLLSAAGTTRLIESGKEQARWHLDQRRYKTDKLRSRTDRWLAVVFGIVGAAGLADIVIRPLLQEISFDFPGWSIGPVSFAFSSFLIIIIMLSMSTYNKLKLK